MNGKARELFKNLSYSVIANIVSMVISFVLVAIVPKVLGTGQYSLWQLYTFYASYVGFFHFGWADGVYLRYGGQEYKELDKRVFHAQYWLLTIFEVLLAAGISIVALLAVSDVDKSHILVMVSLSCFLLLPRTFLQYVLQCTNRIGEYASSVLLEKILYCVLVLAMIFFGARRYEYLLLADIVAKLAALISICIICRDIVFARGGSIKLGFREAFQNISVGIKLMFANVVGMLIIGIVRFSIEMVWGKETFGRVSLAMSVSNLLMLFISAISIVIFPLLKRTAQERWAENYHHLRAMLVVPILGALVLYYPAKMVFSRWLPAYAESLNYMALLFPICLFEGKMSLLVNTYLKALRKEKLMLLINIISVALSLLVSGVVIYAIKNLTLAVLSIVVLLAFRCELAEWLLARQLKLKVKTDMLLELVVVSVFVISSWVLGGWVGFGIYVASFVVYVLCRARSIHQTIQLVLSQVKNRAKPQVAD